MYVCNCGREFENAGVRMIHSATCYVFQSERAARAEAEERRLRGWLQVIVEAHYDHAKLARIAQSGKTVAEYSGPTDSSGGAK